MPPKASKRAAASNGRPLVGIVRHCERVKSAEPAVAAWGMGSVAAITLDERNR